MSSLLKTDSLLMYPDFSHIVKYNSQQLYFPPSLKYPSLKPTPILCLLKNNNHNITSVSTSPYSNHHSALLSFMEKLFKNLFLSTVSKLSTISTNFHILKSKTTLTVHFSFISNLLYSWSLFFLLNGFYLGIQKTTFSGQSETLSFSGFRTLMTLK